MFSDKKKHLGVATMQTDSGKKISTAEEKEVTGCHAQSKK
jgi:hypothetical protein